jgi:microcystin degradation protein MlrC
MNKMRIIVGGCSGEIHTFLTARIDFQPVYANDIMEHFRGTRTPIGGFIDVAEKTGIELVPTVYASVGASPLPTKSSYELVKNETLKRIESAGEIDGVLLALHGALVVEDIEDNAEGDFVAAVRKEVGPDVPIMCTADPHGNVTDTWVDKANAIFACNAIPHIDGYERGREAAETIVNTLRKRIQPVMAVKRPGILTPTGLQLANYPYEKGPLPRIFKRAFTWEKKKGVINVNVFCGFDRADTSNTGASIVVVTDNDRELAKNAAADVAKTFWRLKEEFWLDPKLPQEAVKMAMQSKGQPVVLHDGEDDPGGSGTGDGTEILKTMIEMEVKNAAIWIDDAEAVAKSIEAGVGNTVTMKVGGKLVWREDRKHAQPVEITGRVKVISDGTLILKGPMSTGVKANMGKTAVIDIDGIDLVITESRQAPTPDPQLYRSVGVEPTDKKIVVVKQKHHWRAAYEPIAKKIISVHCPEDYSVSTYGAIDRLTRKPSWPYQKVRRPIWPLDKNTKMW